MNAQACWIDGGCAEAPILCWYHAPATPGLCRGAVLLCPPYGHDYLVSYQAYRMLAEQLAAAEFAVAHIDLQHCGDAADLAELAQPGVNDQQLDLIAIWQENLRRSAQFLRQQSGSEHVILAGLRMGASLVASVAADCQAEALVLFAPVLQGRQYARELLMLKNSNQTGATGQTEHELAGYYFGPALRQGLSKLNLTKLSSPSATVYLIPRDDLDGQEADLIQHWPDSNIISLNFPGYAAMLPADAHSSIVPLALWQQLLLQLQQQFALSAVQPARFNGAPGWQGPEFHEDLLSWSGLQGILTRPKQVQTADPHRRVVILCNTGANHRVGTHRIAVTIARQLAAQGHTVLRFDKSGLGYSRACRDGSYLNVYAEDGVADIQQTLDFLQQQLGFKQFVLAGICSGAYFAYLAACADQRVNGLISINQLTYAWHPGDSLEVRVNNAIKSSHFYRQALFSRSTWRRLLRGQIDYRKILRQMSKRVVKRLRGKLQLASLKLIGNAFLLGEVARNLRQLEQRACRVHLVFDAADAGVDLMTEELGRHAVLLRYQTQASLNILRGADHTFTAIWSQQELVDTISAILSAAD